jgi:hypothetical protein
MDKLKGMKGGGGKGGGKGGSELYILTGNRNGEIVLEGTETHKPVHTNSEIFWNGEAKGN